MRLPLAALLASATVLLAGEVFVCPTGDDGNPGTVDRPFRTIQRGVRDLQPGDTCLVREGIYREAAVLTASGTAEAPIRIRAYPGERVLLDGTEGLGDWQPAGEGRYRTRSPFRFEQLFAGDEMLIEARWPNTTIDRMLTRDGWASVGPDSEYQKLRDPKLAESGIDWNGALAVLNVAHQFWTWTRVVEGYEPGSETLPYTITMNPFHSERRNWWHDDYYYLMGKAEALDAEGEWFLAEDNTVTLVSANPPQNIRAKQRDYAFRGEGLAFVELSGFHFFACTFRFLDSTRCVVENCNLLFPSYSRTIPEGEEAGKRGSAPGTLVSGRENIVRSSSFSHCPNYGVILRGEKNLFEDCIVHDVNWSGTLHYVALRLGGGPGIAEPRNVARHNSLYHVGNAILVCSGPYSIAEYNHVHHGGLVSKDVSLVYTSMPAANGIEFRYNWVHDCPAPHLALGIRGDDKTRGMQVHHNVVWNMALDGIVAKGGRNRIYHNTSLANAAGDIVFFSGPEPDKWWQEHVPAYQEQNHDSLLVNNLAHVIVSTRRPSQPPLPGDHSHNYTGRDPRLMDPANFDFRPRADSPLVNAGRVVEDLPRPFEGEAPDIGAYEFGGENWRPGHRNSIWASRAGENLEIRLQLPVLEPVALEVRQGERQLGTLAFHPGNWDRFQALPGVPATGELVFASEEWGEAVLPDLALVRGLDDARARFPRADIASARIMDSAPKYDYEDTYAADPVALPLHRAYAADVPPTIDGTIGEDEWPGWQPGRDLPMQSLRPNAADYPPAAAGYALFDRDHLYVAVRVTAPGEPLLREGGSWGPQGTGGIELNLATETGRRIDPVYVLHAYPSGKLDSVADGGADAAAATRFGAAVEYAARMLDDQVWTAEFRIPFAALDRELASLPRLRFNLGLRRNGAEGGPWFALAKTGGANYELSQGALLQLDSRISADATNLLVNGGFEDQDPSPWRMAANQDDELPEDAVQRVREGLRGDWCIRLESDDAEAMRDRVGKWTHPFAPEALAPGSYCLSYDVRIVGRSLVARGQMGSFNAYLHVRRENQPGGNLGQSQSLLVTTGDRWLRRDFVIEVPADATPGMVSLQLHRATGAVLVDNVSLIRIQE